MSKKIIITFEGIEGSGKTTHLKNVANYLNKKKINFIVLREPGGSKNAEKIRKLILNNKNNFNVKTDLLLYLASRSENVEKIIKRSYKKKIILIDRFTDSTLAYQYYGMKIDKNIIKKLNKFILGNIKVDYTFLNLINSKNLINRLSKRKKLNRYDKFNSLFYAKVQNGFKKMANQERSRFMIIDSNKSLKLNKKFIIDKINKLIGI